MMGINEDDSLDSDIDATDEEDPKTQNNIDIEELGEGETPSYDRQMSGAQLETYIDDIADTVRVGLDQSISILTPWFFNNMPKIYYQTTPRQEKVRHLSAIITGHVFETKQTVELWDRGKTKVTYIGPGGDRNILLDMAKRLSSHHLKMGGVYFSRDFLLFLSTFHCNEHQELDMVNRRIVEKIRHARRLMLEEFPDKEKEINHYLKYLDNDLVIYATAARLSITFRMVLHMLSHQGSHTFVDRIENSVSARLTLGIKNVSPAEMMEPVLTLIHRYDFNIRRAFVVKLDQGYDESITVMHFIIEHASEEQITDDFVPKLRLVKALRTLGWVDNDEYSVFTKKPYDFSINAVNLIRSMATWAHLFLSKQNPYAYSLYRIRNTFFKYPKITEGVVKLFRLKFDPLEKENSQNGGYESALALVESKIEETVIEDIDRNIYRNCIEFVNHTLKTNYFLPTKTGHAFRLSPKVLDPKYYQGSPYGIFFITGRNFRCFHVRWKDISRGGMRVVMPRNSADYDYGISGLFDEVYGLSHAQQLKNKDIPEGGSKAVLVLKPGAHRDQAVKSAVNALLDLLVEEDESHETAADKMVNYYKKSEIIYLGPDENITNDLLKWIPVHASRRGYRYASAFISSKPNAGINHKEYGVTSEGVNVFVDNTLRYLGLDPKKQKFTVKMTGGPDGDVAGNELKILYREYGENARIVSIADGFGCACDREGLNWQELLRLVSESQSIVHFNRDKLSDQTDAFVLAADSNNNIKIRNEIYAKVYADIFIPAGGRPYSVNEKNWQLFLDSEQKPTLRAIVEGANIFFTAEAREKLQEAGVVIIKDSTANKTGVICSSYEIIASLILSTEEFAAIKEQYVAEVIDILRQKADLEAKLLFSSFVQADGRKTFVELSLEISREINAIKDVMLDELTHQSEDVLEDPLYQEIVVAHCPMHLQTHYRERILEKLPASHKIAIVASATASYIVYREGLGWLKTIPKNHWCQALKIYMEKDKFANSLIKSIESADIQDSDQIQAIMARSAARDLTILELKNQLILS